MKKTVRDIFGDRVVVKTPDDKEPIVVLRVWEYGKDSVANLTPLDALAVGRALIRVAEHTLAKETR